MGLKVEGVKVFCIRCGKGSSKRQGFFLVNYGSLYKGAGYIPVCKECLYNIFNEYLKECRDERTAMRLTCRKLDLYWNDVLFDSVIQKATTKAIPTTYIQRLNVYAYAGKSYDDTRLEEGTMWDVATKKPEADTSEAEREEADIDDEVISFWGPGYPTRMYVELEQRRKYWMSKFPEGMETDIGTEALIRQICNLEIDINKARIEGKPIDKSVNALNTLLGSAKLKPAQKKADADEAIEKTPFGVWIKRWEDKRPIPEPDPEMKDVDGIVRYISIWFLGHLCKMLNIKNTYCKLYEDEIEKMRIERPEFDDDDDETLFNDIFESDDEAGDGT